MAPSQVAATLLVNGQELAFCCEKCLRLFLDAPHKQASADNGSGDPSGTPPLVR
jgi:YHS domain-containing protein